MQAKIVSVGIDTLKVNLKVTSDDSKPLLVQELSEPLEAMFRTWHEQARTRLRPIPTTLTFNDASMTTEQLQRSHDIFSSLRIKRVDGA